MTERNYYIAVGNRFNWGRAKTEKQALANMRKNAMQRLPTTEWTLYHCHETTEVTGMGGLTFLKAHPEPMIVRQKRVKK